MKLMKTFCQAYGLKNLIKEPTCYKNTNNPSSIDVILTNRPNRFHNPMTIETGLSDHHKMVLTVLKTYFKKIEPTIITIRDYKRFNDNFFRRDLIHNLDKIDKPLMIYEDFKQVFVSVLDVHAPIKERGVRGNNAPFMNKTLSKAFMHRSRLKNNCNKNPTEKKNRKYYNNLDVKIFDDNRAFWKRIKPLFSDKLILL